MGIFNWLKESKKLFVEEALLSNPFRDKSNIELIQKILLGKPSTEEISFIIQKLEDSANKNISEDQREALINIIKILKREDFLDKSTLADFSSTYITSIKKSLQNLLSKSIKQILLEVEKNTSFSLDELEIVKEELGKYEATLPYGEKKNLLTDISSELRNVGITRREVFSSLVRAYVAFASVEEERENFFLGVLGILESESDTEVLNQKLKGLKQVLETISAERRSPDLFGPVSQLLKEIKETGFQDKEKISALIKKYIRLQK